MTSWSVVTAGATIPVREFGSRAAESTAILVHGYPDDHRMFLPMIDAIGDRLRVIVYDTRGSALSALNDGAAVDMGTLSEDLYAVARSIPDLSGPLHVFGHDWGSVQTWEAMADSRATSTFASYVSVSGPSVDHLRKLARARGADPRRWGSVIGQLARSWYVGAFHVPVLGRLVPSLMLGQGRGQGAPDSMPGNKSRGVDLYRANILRRMLSGPDPVCDVPVTVVVPVRDRFLSPDLVEGLDTWIRDLEIERVDAGHWWPISNPKQAADLLVRQCRSGSGNSRT